MAVYLSIKKIILAKRIFAKRICLDEETVGRAFTRLAAKKLIDPATQSVCQPDDEREEWFVRINRSSPKWQEQLAYLSIPLPRVLPPGIKWRTLAVHSFLLSKASAEGKAKTCAEEIARILHFDPRTVRKSLIALEAKLLIEFDEQHRLIRVDPPDLNWLEYFQDQKQQSTRPPQFSEDRPWEDKTEAEINDWVYHPDIDALTSILRQMRYIGHYSTIEMQNVRAMVRRHEIDSRTLSIIFQDVQKTHKSNQKTGGFGTLSSFSLLNYRITTQYKPPTPSS